MTKKLTEKEKKERKEERRKSKQQKPASPTVRTVTQPKPEISNPNMTVNLCDDCFYEFGECQGQPKFAVDEATGGSFDDRVIECPNFLNVADMPTIDQVGTKREEAEATIKAALDDLTGGQVELRNGELVKAEAQTHSPEPSPTRPDPKRFLKSTDWGTCHSCGRNLKRTAFNRYHDAVRCTNPRCRAYRIVIKNIPTGAK